MRALLLGLAAILGLAIGSFLNVVIHRVPRGQSVVRPPSACPGCGAAIRNRDNVPVVGWLLLHGRCRDCAERISARYPTVEVLVAGLFVVMAARFGWRPELPAYLYLVSVGVALAIIDLDVKRLPDVLTLPAYPVGAILLGAASVHEPHLWVRAVAGGAAAFAIYFAICFAYPAGMGLGDVKLSGVLGMYTAWLGWDVWGSGLLLAFFGGGLVGIAILLVRRGGRKTAIPFGPFMLAGALAAILVGHQLVHAYLRSTIGA